MSDGVGEGDMTRGVLGRCDMVGECRGESTCPSDMHVQVA